jgi:hypothetical protein
VLKGIVSPDRKQTNCSDKKGREIRRDRELGHACVRNGFHIKEENAKFCHAVRNSAKFRGILGNFARNTEEKEYNNLQGCPIRSSRNTFLCTGRHKNIHIFIHAHVSVCI